MTARWLKAAIVACVATALSFWLWTSLRQSPATFPDALLASVIGAVSMPLLLWAGMRALRERGNHLLVLVGAVAWLLIGAHVVEDDVSAAGTVAFLALFVALTAGAGAIAAARTT